MGELVLKADGGTVEIIKRGDQMWMKLDTAYWKEQLPGERGETAARLFEDRYIHGSTRDRVLKGRPTPATSPPCRRRSRPGPPPAAP